MWIILLVTGCKSRSLIIQGIDFPSLYVEKAFHDDQKGKLYFSICDGDKTKTNRSTTVEVFNLPNSNSIDVLFAIRNTKSGF